LKLTKKKKDPSRNDESLYLWYYNFNHQHGIVPRDIFRLELRHQKKKLLTVLILVFVLFVGKSTPFLSFCQIFPQFFYDLQRKNVNHT